MTVTLVIPAYNEERRLGPFLQSVAVYMKRPNHNVVQVIVVDDGSTDRTGQIARSFASTIPNLQVATHAQNRGKGAAVQTGVMAGQADAIVFMDADGATPIDELPKMIAALQKAQIAVGNRWMIGAQTERHSLLRRLAGWVYRRYMGLFGLGAIDTMCGFKGYRRDVARALFADLIEERWLFDTEIAYKAVSRGYTITNFPIRWESKNGSKLSTVTLIKSALQIWPLIRKIKPQKIV